ncbi:MAG: NAD-dependent epimerase/dehydratase family protein, partial [Clostridium sp.]|nr:NAD-dependent epimerase/dehydratase family protein [Clostridium sp.]
LPDGNVELLGRIDDQVKIRGFRIEIGEIENKILSCDSVKEGTVIIKEDENNEKYLCAFIVYNEEGSKEKLKEYLRKTLPKYMIPSYFVTLDKMPLTVNGKIDKKALGQIQISVKSKSYIAPRNEIEKRLLEEWIKITKAEGLGVKDDYFDYGGTSLKVIKFMLKLSDEFSINVNDVFESKTIEELAKRVSFSKTSYIEKLDLEKAFSSAEEEVLSPLEGVKEYNLKNQKYLNLKLDEYKNYKEVLLNGSTGFLGINILNKLLEDTNYNISLIVRGKNIEDSKLRIKNIYNYHFKCDVFEKYGDRIKIYRGDLTKEYFGLNKEVYESISKNIDCIINSAANVKHYGDYKASYNINVKAVEFMIDFAKLNKKKDIHHVSTISVSMGTIENKSRIMFTEYDCDLGQKLENIYVSTKLEAEKILIKARNEGINTNIYRVGNLVGDSKTGIFQKNIEDNAFYQRIKSYIKLGILQESSLDFIEFSFINDVSHAIVKLFDINNLNNEIYHLYNPNKISNIDFVKLLRASGVEMNLLKGENYINKLKEMYKDDRLKDTINNLIVYSEVYGEEVSTEAITFNEKSEMILKRLGFKWHEVNESVISKMIKYLKEIEFI